MLSLREKGIIFCIIDHCERVEEKAIGQTCETFKTNRDIKEIICFNIFQIGELIKNLSDDFLAKHKDAPWKDITGMRDIIGHGYGTIDLDIVWYSASNEVTPLKEYCQLILEENKQKEPA